jgi:inorganic phosphate transporter, PiT family
MTLFGETVAVSAGIFLLLALLIAFSFEFVNGFHDTANAVATVIYTNALPAVPAVIWSGMWNLIGVLVSTGAVAFGIVALLPVELVLNVGSDAGFAMVFSLLISAMIWNVGTWYFGLPASSSHTLIGSIMGVGLANAIINGRSFGEGVNWSQAQSVFAALIFSPIIGFALSALLLLAAKALIKRPEFFKAPSGDSKPPLWVRGLLILTCTGVSFAHGNNDGQKGMGLVMLILIGILPGAFALNLDTNTATAHKVAVASAQFSTVMASHAPSITLTPDLAKASLSDFLKQGGKPDDNTFAALAVKSAEIAAKLDSAGDVNALSTADRSLVRSDMYLVSGSIDKLDKSSKFANKAEDKSAKAYQKQIDGMTKFIPVWVKFAVALALGFGTMIGWKRIVVTVGEKIGKEHLTYAQGASAEIVAAGTIGLASGFGLPVSTTHVLSSGIAGTMAANGSGLQSQTVRNIVLAWVLTLPVCVFLGATTFSLMLYVILHVLHVQ